MCPGITIRDRRAERCVEKIEDRLLQFRHPIDDAELDVVSELDLDQFGREVFADVRDLLRAELELPAAAFHKMIEQETREVLDFIVVGMLAEIKDLRHGRPPAIRLRRKLIAESPVARQCPKGRGSVLTFLNNAIAARSGPTLLTKVPDLPDRGFYFIF